MSWNSEEQDGSMLNARGIMRQKLRMLKRDDDDDEGPFRRLAIEAAASRQLSSYSHTHRKQESRTDSTVIFVPFGQTWNRRKRKGGKGESEREEEVWGTWGLSLASAP